ncbi:MAG: NBR1-Ig-like domain-containing protein [Anaerolineales bacterium]|nr:NBR1-Ig-like domain-containing protein [Anaerolineales bacterium]
MNEKLRNIDRLRRVRMIAASSRLLVMLAFLSVIVLSFSGCVLPGQPTPELPPPVQDLIGTSIAETLAAYKELSKEDFKIYLPLVGNGSEEEEIEEQIEQTPTPTETPTVTETPTSTPEPPTSTPITPTPLPCLLAKFVQDINVPPGTVFAGGTKFTKIWRVQNAGSCTWTRNFTLMWVAGDPLGSKSQVALPGVVQPGQTVDLQIELVAPKADGTYKGAWMINDNAGHIFGIGKNGTEYLWVEIKVKNVATSPAKSATPTPKPTTAPTATPAPSATPVPTNTTAPSATFTATPTPTIPFTDTATATSTNTPFP